MYPIRDPWWSRPGWSEFGAWRAGNKSHDGLDLYTRRGTAIWAHGPGRVSRKGFAPGHGHWVAVMYDDGVEVSYSHMLHASPRAEQARVDDRTRLGQVGDTGNAKGNDWVHGSPIPGVALQHVHVEVRRGGLGNPTINPRTYFDRLTQAGGSATPISPTPMVPSPEEDDMPKLIRRVGEATLEWSLFDPSLRGPSDLERGYIVITNQNTARDFARTYAGGFGNEQTETRSVYVDLQKSARIAHQAYQRGLPAATTSSGGFTDSDRSTLNTVRAVVEAIRDALNRIFK